MGKKQTKEEAIQAQLDRQGGVTGTIEPEVTEETAVVKVQLPPGVSPAPFWRKPDNEEQALEQIQSYKRKTIPQLYKIGKTLLWLQENAKYELWENYLDTKVGMNLRTAQRMIKVVKDVEDMGGLPAIPTDWRPSHGKKKVTGDKLTRPAKDQPKPSGEVTKQKNRADSFKFQAQEERKARKTIEKDKERAEREARKAQEKLAQKETRTMAHLTLDLTLDQSELEKRAIRWLRRSLSEVEASKVVLHLEIKEA